MPVVINRLTLGNSHLPGYGVAKELARQTIAHFGSVRGANAGIGPGSCCAAFAVIPNSSFPASTQLAFFEQKPYGEDAVYNYVDLGYGIVYGNSQMAGGGLVSEAVGGHAERAALTAAGGIPVYLEPGNNAVLLVELCPCNPCNNWLHGWGGGMSNPYIAIFNSADSYTTLNVWWLWPYPGGGGVDDMNAFHHWGLQTQLDYINTYF